MNLNNAKSRIMHSDPISAVTDKIGTLGKVVVAATSAKALASALNPDVPMRWMLRSMNLQRRPSAFSRIAVGVGLITVGAAVGAGVALLLSPKTGVQNRAALRRSLWGIEKDAEGVVEQVGEKAQEVVEQVEARARNVMHHAETPNDAAKSGGGTTGTKPRTPGLSHRSPPR